MPSPSNNQRSSPTDTAPSSRGRILPPAHTWPDRGYLSDPRPETTGVLDGTPYEVAPPAIQQRVVAHAQFMLARRGYYRSDIDGVYGPETQFALRAYQARIGLVTTGRLDSETLAALGMLPGRHRLGPPSRRFPWQRPEPRYQDEWVPEQELLF